MNTVTEDNRESKSRLHCQGMPDEMRVAAITLVQAPSLHVVPWVPCPANAHRQLFAQNAHILGRPFCVHYIKKSSMLQAPVFPERKASCLRPRESLARIQQHWENKDSVAVWERRGEEASAVTDAHTQNVSHSTLPDPGGQKRCLTHTSFSGAQSQLRWTGVSALAHSCPVFSSSVRGL